MSVGIKQESCNYTKVDKESNNNFKCDICDVQFGLKILLVQHELTCHQKGTLPREIKQEGTTNYSNNIEDMQIDQNIQTCYNQYARTVDDFQQKTRLFDNTFSILTNKREETQTYQKQIFPYRETQTY